MADRPSERATGFSTQPPGTVLVVFEDGSGIVRGDGTDREREDLLALLHDQLGDDPAADVTARVLLEHGFTLAPRVDPDLAADPRAMGGEMFKAIADVLLPDARPTGGFMGQKPSRMRRERPMTVEELVALMLEIRDGTSHKLATLAIGEGEDEALIEDARIVWHTSEIALALLRPGKYLPKREAVPDARALVDWYASLDEPEA